MSDTAASFSDICTACGLCCDGTLFGQAMLDPDELDAAKASGFILKDFAGKQGFTQPCKQLCGSICGIYASRPNVCRSYQCSLLKRVADGDVSSGDAAKHIAEAKTAVANLKAELLPGETIGESKIRLHKALQNVEGAEASPRFKLVLGVVELLLDKHFRKASDRVFGNMAS